MEDPIEAYIRAWHDIEPPNLPARRMAAQLDETITAFARLRREPDFMAPPTDFAQMLHSLRDQDENDAETSP